MGSDGMHPIGAGSRHMAEGDPKRVLVVDDDPDWREYLRWSLSDLGYEVDEAASGTEALAALARERYSVVLLDHYMPGMSGEEVAKKLPPNGPKIVLV